MKRQRRRGEATAGEPSPPQSTPLSLTVTEDLTATWTALVVWSGHQLSASSPCQQSLHHHHPTAAAAHRQRNMTHRVELALQLVSYSLFCNGATVCGAVAAGETCSSCDFRHKVDIHVTLPLIATRWLQATCNVKQLTCAPRSYFFCLTLLVLYSQMTSVLWFLCKWHLSFICVLTTTPPNRSFMLRKGWWFFL